MSRLTVNIKTVLM